MSEHGGSVLAVASVGGFRSGSPISAYGDSKAALIHLVRLLGTELGPTVRVNAIAPAVVEPGSPRRSTSTGRRRSLLPTR